MARPLILVTNDDGIHAPGLAELATALDGLGEVWVFAPDSQQSAVGHGVSLHRPLRVKEWKERRLSVDGTPTDCVMLAVRSLLPRRPDLVVSGINPGANLGDDVTYSGTVAGAYEGMMLGIKALAVSDVSYAPTHFDTGGKVAAIMARWLLDETLPPDTVLNLNYPDVPFAELKGFAWTKMGRRDYQDEIVVRQDPRGGTYYWIGGAEPSHVDAPDTDFEAIARGQVSVTPLHRDLTNYEALRDLEKRSVEL